MTLALPRRRRTAVPVPHLPVPLRVHGRPRTRRQLRAALDAERADRTAAADTVDRLNADLKATAKERDHFRLQCDEAQRYMATVRAELHRLRLHTDPAAIEPPRPRGGISLAAPIDNVRDGEPAEFRPTRPEDTATQPIQQVSTLQQRGPITLTQGENGGTT